MARTKHPPQGSAMAQAAAFPSRPLRVVIAFPPGAAHDTLGRTLAAKTSGTLAAVVAGSGVAGLASEIAAYGAETGTNHILLRVQWRGLDQKTALRTLERLGRVVEKVK